MTNESDNSNGVSNGAAAHITEPSPRFVVVTHLHRLRYPTIGVACTDVTSGQSIRFVHNPVLGSAGWTSAHLVADGGPFEIGALLELDGTVVKPDRSRPHVEDLLLPGARAIHAKGRLQASVFGALIEEQASESVAGIFGEDLMITPNHRAYVEPERGKASLGFLRCRNPQLARADHILRLRFADSTGTRFDLHLADLRLRYRNKGWRVHSTLCEHVTERLENENGVILALGLTRQNSRDGLRPANWLQVDNIHFGDYFDDDPAFAPA